MNPSNGPTTQPERIEILDALRGFAVLGILVLNIGGFAMPPQALDNPSAYGDLTGINLWIWSLSFVFGYQKMMAIFAMLFGAGIVLMGERIESVGGVPSLVYFRRIFFLLLFGLAHAYGLWFGDVLTRYVMCAVVVFWLWKLPAPYLLASGIAVFLVSVLIAFWHGLPYWFMNSEQARHYNEHNWHITAQDLKFQLSVFRGNYFQFLSFNTLLAYLIQINVFIFRGGIFRPMGMMIVGMALYKWGILSGKGPAWLYRVFIAFAVFIALPLIAVDVYLFYWSGWSGIYFHGIVYELNHALAPAVSMGYISLFVTACQREWFSGLRSLLAAAGQMALSNYLMQSVICAFFFFGFGFGFFGYVERWGQFLLMISIWIFQLFFSSMWLKKFRFGPMEWLWRSLTYWKLQPFRR